MLRKAEWGVALLVTALVVYLHFVFFQHAGGLWRDEVGTIRLAARPDLPDVWAYLLYDSFPAFWVIVTRAWLWLGLGSDNGLRLLGLLVGLSVLGALWFNARRLKISFPFFSLLLLGFSPTIILWGDSMRAWGWGTFWILMTFGLIWRVVESPSRLNFLGATMAAIGSVHTTYYNWVLLFALCAAGSVVALRHGQWKRSVLVLGIGLVAVVSVIPYLIGIHHIAGHYLIAQIPFDFERFVTKITEAVTDGRPASGYIWALLLMAALAMAVFCQFRPSVLKITAGQNDLLLFSITAFAIGIVGYFLFLRNLKFGTQSWYYSSLMAVTALAIDAVLSVLGNWERGRKLRLVFVVVVLGLMAPPVWNTVRMRMTNMDLIAKRLSESVNKGDLIVVNPWYCGISFQYYYSGEAPWTTLPELQDHKFHCYDTVVQIMMKPDQMEAIGSVLDKITETLKSGNRVFLVGGLTYPPPNQKPPSLPAAPNGPAGWSSTPYQKLWSLEAGYFVQSHVQQYKDFIVAPEEGTVNPAEYMPLTVVQGWRDK
ncbi:hypothetical protein [Pedosphaera parvula]|uniref:Glycosyltransferase RgtA/B/C/D-like domain-containing protein n=1 Tax=Pedosphaera parvula (strain Ellin514) TaxID=320771 RepID=B9XJ76_PEDPL|nr:hypothetical protein [Pedosphaera parvula]EEF60114.1 hypothetical protein Cflav_PD3173 [Pedosphaera parvula Ellin514]